MVSVSFVDGASRQRPWSVCVLLSQGTPEKGHNWKSFMEKKSGTSVEGALGNRRATLLGDRGPRFPWRVWTASWPSSPQGQDNDGVKMGLPLPDT